MTKAVFGLANSEEQAHRIVERLLSSGFFNEDISILCADKNKETNNPKYSNEMHTRKSGLGTEKHSKAPEGGLAGATTGGIIGGSIGLLAGLGSLAIPGLGPFIAAGPLMAALSGSGIGGGLGLVIGTLVGAGIPEYEAKRFESGLKNGNILISVQTDNDKEIDRAREIMKKEGAKDISSSREKTESAY